MRILLDACIPQRLRSELDEFDVSTVPFLGWGDLDDGPLFDVMQDSFDVFITVDKSIPAQQNLDDRPFAVIVLLAKSNRFEELKVLVPEIIRLLGSVKPGRVYKLS